MRNHVRPTTDERDCARDSTMSNALVMLRPHEFVVVPALVAESELVMLAVEDKSQTLTAYSFAVAYECYRRTLLRVPAAIPAVDNSAHGFKNDRGNSSVAFRLCRLRCKIQVELESC
nr:hypothetical protein CFP56_41280 [Quercus suber]